MSEARRTPLQLAILISGRGSNMAAIARACRAGEVHASVCLVVSDRADAAGLELAHGLGIPTQVVPSSGVDRAAFEQTLSSALDQRHPDLIVLAGFMRILSASFVRRYAGRILNIHPALLPRHRGLHTHRRVLAAGDSEHGASVHFVTAELDGGPVVLQSRLRVGPADSESSLAARVQRTEHRIYPQVIEWIARGRLAWRSGAPWLDGRPLERPIIEDFP